MKKLTLVLFVFSFLFSCSKEDGDTNLGSNHVVAFVNGVKFNSEGYGSILAEYKRLSNGLYQFVFVASSKVNDSGEYKRILVRVVLPYQNTFQEGLGIADNGETSFANPFGFYEEEDINTGFKITYSDTNESRKAGFSITALDTVRKKISGTFRFNSYDSKLYEPYEITDGTFNDITYKDLINNQ